MNITWVIGNGFDIKCKMKTKYEDFYASPYVQTSNNAICKLIVDFINNGRNASEINWADMETGLGDYTKKYPGKVEAELIQSIKDLNRDLQSFILEAENAFGKIETSQYDAFFNTLNTYPSALCEQDQFDYQRLLVSIKGKLLALSINISYISFNYTNVFAKFWNSVPLTYDSKLNAISCHIQKKNGCNVHGTLHNGLVMGCDNNNQYNNIDYPGLCNYLEKPIINTRAGHRNNEVANSIISTTDVFLIFGSSLGETDETWWNQIAKRVIENANGRVILFFYDPEYDNSYSFARDSRDAAKDAFIKRLSGFDEKQLECLKSRIMVTCKLDEIFNCAS